MPDLAGWRRHRYRVPRTHGHTRAPDWIAEILSPSTARRDRILKLAIYAREAVSHVWLVDPVLETLEVYALRDGVYALVQTAAGEVTARLEPFADEALDLTRWWVRAFEQALAEE